MIKFIMSNDKVFISIYIYDELWIKYMKSYFFSHRQQNSRKLSTADKNLSINILAEILTSEKTKSSKSIRSCSNAEQVLHYLHIQLWYLSNELFNHCYLNKHKNKYKWLCIYRFDGVVIC